MLLNETLRREIGREAVRFCRRCPLVEERIQEDHTVLICQNSQCRLWAFLRLLGLRPGADFEAPTWEEALREAHAREVRGFRGLLPLLGPGHDWEADAGFHSLVPGMETVRDGTTAEKNK